MRRGSTPERAKISPNEGSKVVAKEVGGRQVDRNREAVGQSQGVGTDKLKHAAIDRDDEAALLRKRDDMVRQDQHAAPVPADQCFRGDDAARRQLDLRLVAGFEFVELEGAAEGSGARACR